VDAGDVAEHVGLDAEAIHGGLEPLVDLGRGQASAAHRYAPGRRWQRVGTASVAPEAREKASESYTLPRFGATDGVRE
jgi:hypothetical protein